MKKIIHIDMDAFFAQVEQRDNPEYRGKPIIIGSGNPNYGVVSTCSYEARKFGVRSAMPNAKAYRLCPHGIFVRQTYNKYQVVSEQIFTIFHEVTDLVEGLSLDEAFLDVTNNKLGLSSATDIAKYIKARIFTETQLTASAGVSYNKLLAKLGSEYQKPDGLTIIPPHKSEAFLKTVALKDISGVGKKVQAKMHILGIDTIDDLLAFSREDCVKYFNAFGYTLYDYIRGIDHREVKATRIRKSIGHETTLHIPYQNIFACEQLLTKFTIATLVTMRKKNIYAKTFSVKIKYSDFSQYTRAVTLSYPSNINVDFTKHINSLLFKFPHQNKEIRLVGVSFSKLYSKDELKTTYKDIKTTQTKLF